MRSPSLSFALLLGVVAVGVGCGARSQPGIGDGGASPRTDHLVPDVLRPDGALPGSCRQNSHCAADRYCYRPNCSTSGTCQPRPVSCDLLYAPVCGCDGQTYGNPCEAAMNGVSVAADGECVSPLICWGSYECPADAFCLLGPDCGAFLEPGTCVPRPDGCDDNYDPVCGCDGATYSNECQANAAGVSVSYHGPCYEEQPCFFNEDCFDGQICNLDGHCGERSSRIGYCEWLPSGCPKNYAPVCGCDGKTYDNDCFAHLMGVSVRTSGDCQVALSECELLREEYRKTVMLAKGCAPLAPLDQCTTLIDNNLPCGCPTFVNAYATDALRSLDDLRVKWQDLDCDIYPWPCPDCMLPSDGACDPATGSCADYTN